MRQEGRRRRRRRGAVTIQQGSGTEKATHPYTGYSTETAPSHTTKTCCVLSVCVHLDWVHLFGLISQEKRFWFFLAYIFHMCIGEMDKKKSRRQERIIKKKEKPQRNLKYKTSIWMRCFLLPPLLCCSAAAGHRLLQCFARCRGGSNTLSRKDGALPYSASGCQNRVRAKRTSCQKVNTACIWGINKPVEALHHTSCYCGDHDAPPTSQSPQFTILTSSQSACWIFYTFFSGFIQIWPFWWSVYASFYLLLHH